MTRSIYNAHRVLAGIFVLAILFSAANYYLELGFFGSGAKGVVLMILGLFLIYASFFSPTREDMREHRNARKAAKAPHP